MSKETKYHNSCSKKNIEKEKKCNGKNYKNKERNALQLQLKVNEYKDEIKRLKSQKGIQISERKKQKKDLFQKGEHLEKQRYQFLAKESQELSKKTLQKYKKLENQFQRYKKEVQEQMIEIKIMNKKLISQNKKLQKNIDPARQQSIERKSRSAIDRIVTSAQKSDTKTQDTYFNFKNKEKQWEQKEIQWVKKENTWKQKQNQMKEMLEQISQRLSKLQKQSVDTTYKKKYQYVNEKLKQKTLHWQNKKAHWGKLFREFYQQSKKLSQQIQEVKCKLYQNIKSAIN